jgi:hypothetical protein
MRYVLGFVCVLALAMMGCGNGGGVTDCTAADDHTQCTLDGADGLCIEEKCLPYDCSGFEDQTACLLDHPVGLFIGFCDAGLCVVLVA